MEEFFAFLLSTQGATQDQMAEQFKACNMSLLGPPLTDAEINGTALTA
jgi:hypothetical protein